MHNTKYVLQREDGQFYYKWYGSSRHGWTEDFNKAFYFETKKGAKSRMYTSGDMNCKIQEVNCRLIDEDEPEYTVNEVTEEIANKYDGKCYVDYDTPERIEAVRFFKTKKGLSGQYIGCSYTTYYNHTLNDRIGTKGVENTFNLTSINMIEDNCGLYAEISKDDFDRMVKIAETMKSKINEMHETINNYKRTFECYKNHCYTAYMQGSLQDGQ